MKLENKVLIIYQFASENNLDASALIGQAFEPLAEDFIKEYELGVSLANVLVSELCEINSKGIEIINATYEAICDEMEVDSSKEYTDISDLHDEWRTINEEDE
jgi:hypothetical protein